MTDTGRHPYLVAVVSVFPSQQQACLLLGGPEGGKAGWVGGRVGGGGGGAETLIDKGRGETVGAQRDGSTNDLSFEWLGKAGV